MENLQDWIAFRSEWKNIQKNVDLIFYIKILTLKKYINDLVRQELEYKSVVIDYLKIEYITQTYLRFRLISIVNNIQKRHSWCGFPYKRIKHQENIYDEVPDDEGNNCMRAFVNRIRRMFK